MSVGRTALGEIAALADEAGAPGIRKDAEGLSQRLAEGRFYVVCLGQFKRGKSTLLNTLIGTSLLPTGVAPVTSVVTILRFRERRGARVRTAETGWQEIAPEALADYVTEDRNPGNTKRVTGIEVFEPAPLLGKGLCLVDTPGIGSVFGANTTATREFLPQVDAALVVLGADPPITGDELALVAEVAERVPRLMFVLSKADRISDIERGEALTFTRRVLRQRLGRDVGPIFEVSATEVQSQGLPSRDWTALGEALERLATGAGADLVAGAERRGTANLADRLIVAIEEQIRTIERPLGESQARLAQLRIGIARAEQALSDLAPLFAAEEARLMHVLESERDNFLRGTARRGEKDLETALRFVHERGPALRRRAIDEALAAARTTLAEWQTDRSSHLDRLFRSAMQRFADLGATVELTLAESTGNRIAGMLAIEMGLRAPSHFYMTEMLTVAPVTLGKRILDVVGGASERRNQAIRRDARDYRQRLIEVNSTRIKNDLRDRLTVSRRDLETEVRRRLGDMAISAEQALERARTLQESGVTHVEAERERLRHLLAKAEALRNRTATERGASDKAS